MNKKEQNKIYLQAEMFGLDNRMTQATEELAELIQALCKYKRVQSGDKTVIATHIRYNIIEEIADVEICIEQLKHLLDINNVVEEIKKNKIIRTEQRIKGEL